MNIDYSAMKVAKLFMNGQSQAVRLPKEFRFAGTEVLVKQVGSAVVLLPMSKSWDSLLSSLELFSADFLVDRDEPRDFDERETV